MKSIPGMSALAALVLSLPRASVCALVEVGIVQPIVMSIRETIDLPPVTEPIRTDYPSRRAYRDAMRQWRRLQPIVA